MPGQETRAFLSDDVSSQRVLAFCDTFSRCIEQDFEVPEVDEGGVPIAHVRHNKVFLEAFSTVSRVFLEIEQCRDNGNELTERTDLVGVFGLFALYRYQFNFFLTLLS